VKLFVQASSCPGKKTAFAEPGVDKERKCGELKTETFCNPITVQLLPALVYNTRDNDIGSEKV